MKSRWPKRVLTALVVIPLLVGGVWILSGGKLRDNNKEPWPENAPRGERDSSAVMVTVQPVTFRTVRRSVEAVGTLYAWEEVIIAAKVEGRVRKILREVSDRVRPGELLLEVDPADNQLMVRQAEKAMLVELSRLGLKEPPLLTFDVFNIPAVMQAKARLDNSKTRYDRARDLSARNAIAGEELSDKAADYRAAQAEYDSQLLSARSGLAMIQMKQESLAMCKQQLSDTQLIVPTPTKNVPGGDENLTYAITARMASEGNFLKSGTEVFKLALDRTLKMRAPVPERYSADVRVGQIAEVTMSAYAEPFRGTVTRINPSIDTSSRTFEVEIQVANTEGKLKPGSFAKANIFTREDTNVGTVPLEALVTFAGVNKIYVMEDNKAREIQVVPGIQDVKWIEIQKPKLAKDTIVITSGQTVIANDVKVQVRKEKK